MRIWLRAHVHTVSTFVAMALVALLFGTTMGASVGGAPVLSAVPASPIDIPPATDHLDRDTYADDVDLVDGDAHVRIELQTLEAGDIRPYFVVGTQDDHWRMGLGRELEWRHVVDPDPLGYDVGSKAWADHALRTGAWWYSIPMESSGKVVADRGDLDGNEPGVEWPHVFHVNVREDEPTVAVRIELMAERSGADREVAAWEVLVDIPSGQWHHAGASFTNGTSGTLTSPDAQLTLAASIHNGMSQELQTEIASKWAPELRFSEDERFYPTSGDAMQRFHGFGRSAPSDHDLRTWTRSFNNGRDGYVLLLADFNGDRVVDEQDVQIMTSVLREGGVAGDTVYAHVFDTTGDRVVVQFWFLYIYNFVTDESGDSVPRLAHRGDREFVQLSFSSRDDARNGTPDSIAYSQHYRGIRIIEPDMDDAPFHTNGTHMVVYPARGSHASYPVAGNDRKFRPALAGYGDVFDGQGETWTMEDYELLLFDRQEWAFGHLWGPATRFSRDLGTSTKPFLQYTFRYAYIDPLPWELRLKELDQNDLRDLYGAAT